MFTSLEGKAKRNYQACDEKGDLMPKKILEKVDMIYGTSMSFRVLNAKLCGQKQGPQESRKDYYERMVDISVALKEYRFQPGELAWMKKACFFRSPGELQVPSLPSERSGGYQSGLYAEGDPGM